MEAQAQAENDRRHNDNEEEEAVSQEEAESDEEGNELSEQELKQHLADREAFERSIQESMSPIDRQHAPIRLADRRIHIIGTGSIGKLVAHALRGIPDPPPITLLFHRYKLLQAWNKGKKVITVADGEAEVPRGGFDIELLPMVTRQHGVELQRGQNSVWDMADSTGMLPHDVAAIVKQQQAGQKAAAQEEASSQEQSAQEHFIQEALAQEEHPQETPAEEDSKPQQPAFEPIDTNPQSITMNPRGPGLPYVKDDMIHNLIVTTKTVTTVAALAPLKHRLNRNSTICFLQNGMGVIDDINEQVFPNEATRPTYVQGVINHGANSPPEKAESDPFYVIHAGHGTISLAILPREEPQPTPSDTAAEQSEADLSNPTSFSPITPSSADVPRTSRRHYPETARYIIRTLTRTPVLAAVGYTPLDLLQLQLEKLAVNSILNPLTALLDARNGAVLGSFHLVRTARMLLAETSLVIRSLPELRHLPNVEWRFSAKRLEKLYTMVAAKTGGNVSSMLADVRAGRRTEIEYINGYIVRRGEDLGVKCVVNYSFMQMVMGKKAVVAREVRDEVPVLGKRSGLNPEL
ncbi:hypothetical protein TI39_contig351g00005 [Zymoseptoria brevis]|uniref:2-dehydropantoate 2-reductase n=1 Tax=Zymoseptoria brevis TaxID=1047168 RepID=A0A0F4GRD4_9PEZI|nr:hypothetical protein TI39_contig351g00005 [Zymoseptoria brevis]